jgi:hypothetical protein
MFYLQKYKNTRTLLQRQKRATHKFDTELRSVLQMSSQVIKQKVVHVQVCNVHIVKADGLRTQHSNTLSNTNALLLTNILQTK